MGIQKCWFVPSLSCVSILSFFHMYECGRIQTCVCFQVVFMRACFYHVLRVHSALWKHSFLQSQILSRSYVVVFHMSQLTPTTPTRLKERNWRKPNPRWLLQILIWKRHKDMFLHTSISVVNPCMRAGICVFSLCVFGSNIRAFV